MEKVMDDLYVTSRTVVLWFVKDGFGKNSERELEALKEALDYIGVRTVITKDNKLKSIQSKYQDFIEKLKVKLTQVIVDESDGLEQEIAEVGDILFELREEFISERAHNIFGF